MAVKLDVLINYIVDNTKLKRNIASINNMMTKGILAPRSAGGATFDPLRAMLSSGKDLVKFADKWKKHSSDVLKNTIATINKLNVGGFFKDYIQEDDNKSGRRINLNKDEVKNLAEKMTSAQLKSELEMMRDEERAEAVAWEENRKFNERTKIQERRNQEAEARKIMGEEKWNRKMNILHSKALEENKKRDEALRKKQWMLMLGKWGKLGVWGFVAQQAIKYISKAVGVAYSTSMQGLDWQRTISGGASGGTWFGQGLAAYQRAGINANAYQGFKRGIQGYMGSVKLGMGNAAPLMYLGISALENLDDTEKQIEQALRKLPDQVSLSLAQQMGLSYEMWHAIYTGKLDRERDAYSKDAIEKWSKLADGFNEILTKIKTIFFNGGAAVAGEIGETLSAMARGKSGIHGAMQLGSPVFARSMLDLPGAIASSLIKFGAVEVVVKNEQGEVLGKGESYADIGMQVPKQWS